MKSFGCLCYVTKNTPQKTKFDVKTFQCIFLSYVLGHKAKKAFDLKTYKIYISGDVVFFENIFSYTAYSNLSPAYPLFVINVLTDQLDNPSDLTDNPFHIFQDHNSTLEASSIPRQTNISSDDYISDFFSTLTQPYTVSNPIDMLDTNNTISIIPSSTTSSRIKKTCAWLSKFVFNVSTTSANGNYLQNLIFFLQLIHAS